ncbi:MAG TPA: CPCC family cysteine-rich protein [Bacilli bacterium]|nr:CPCC family cysteine-rich protein [Bacilli bacterium]HPV69869.1 CPCC family cysteine-rich protein [Bacilli bacterium]
MATRCCSCCGEFTLGKGLDGEICPICGWVKDAPQEANPRLASGPNKKSLAEARNIYFAHRRDHTIF